MTSTLTVLFVAITAAAGYPQFQSLIPNGNKVPNPCNPSQLWPGVGHQLVGGTGVRNPFGLDFFQANKNWTTDLCKKDSDGDGFSNGAELGDPDCTWKPNGVPKYTTSLSHPGICEPVGSMQCMNQNSWLACPKTFSCPAFEKNNTQRLDLFLPANTSVPANETTYICQAFKMPNDTKYHNIGITPHIVNKEIMHHMLLYGCTEKPDDALFDNPMICGMGMPGCQTIIGLWSVGMDGECHPDQYGFPIGQGGFQYTVVQLHWNNPSLKTGMTDGSGISMYYTDQLRPNDAMVVMTGQQYLNIPPQQPSVKFEGACTPVCTNFIKPQTVKISAAFLHMHLQGKSGSAELIRNGKVTVLLNESSYDYNTPITHRYDQPYEFNGGDEIRVYCEYNSMKSNKTTYWGEGTQDEMCYVFVTIYPAVTGFDFCGQYLRMDWCSMPQYDPFTYNNCSIDTFQGLLPPMGASCAQGCSKMCKAVMNALYSTGCMQGVVWEFITTNFGQYSPQFQALMPIFQNCWPDDDGGRTMLPPATSTLTPSVSSSPASAPGCFQNVNSGPTHTAWLCSVLITASFSLYQIIM